MEREYVTQETIDQRKKCGDCVKCGNYHQTSKCRTGWRTSPPPQEKTNKNNNNDKKWKRKDTGTLKVAELGGDNKSTTGKITELDSGEDSDSGKD